MAVLGLRLLCWKPAIVDFIYHLVEPMILFDRSTFIDFPCNVEFETSPTE